MASVWCLAVAPPVFSPSPIVKIPNGAVSVSPRSVLVSIRTRPGALRRRRRDSTVCMAANAEEGEGEEEEGQKRRHPLDFPYEWVRPKAPARTNVFPKFPALSTPLPTWLPCDQEPDDEIDEDELENEEEQEQPEEYPEQFE